MPTTYYEADKDYAGSGIAAKWDFTGLTAKDGAVDAVFGLTDSEAEFPATAYGENGGLKQANGTESDGATLVPFGAWKKNRANGNPDSDGVAQSKNSNSSSLDKFDESAGFTLTLSQPANIVVKGRGAGAAAPTRFIIIADASGKKLAYKANLRNSKAEEFVVKGAAAGEYKIYVNGSCVYYIDLSKSSADFKEPAQITELKLYNKAGTAEAPAEIDSFEVYESVTFTAKNVVSEDNKEEMTADAEWTSSDENVATVKGGVVTGTGEGTAIIRARIGRFYDERTVTVTKSTKTRATFFAAENLPTAEKELGLDWTADDVKETADKLLKAVVAGNFVTVSDATIKFFNEKTSWNPKPTARVKTELDFASAWDKVFGIRMKADKYNDGKFDQNFKFCEIKFTVTPASTPVVIGLEIAAKGGKNVNITPTIGSDSKTAVKVGSSASAVTQLLAEGVTVSGATEITIAFSVADSGKDGVGFGFQDLVLSAALAE
ncbi:MAG: hypothetical protein K2J50_02420 [Treponemataceae bacterium]|nr:hypothetical protein [Treponemataceae bacterium]